MNLYAYVGNDPINKNDPTGTIECPPGAQCYGSIYSASYDKAKVNPGTMGKIQTEQGKKELVNLGVNAATTAIPAGWLAKAGRLLGLEKAGKVMTEAFHYTFGKSAPSILKDGLRPGSFATTNGNLSPVQATIDLALPPNRGLPDTLLKIDVDGMRTAGFEIPDVTQAGRMFGMPGGGAEMQFPYAVPSEFISAVH